MRRVPMSPTSAMGYGDAELLWFPDAPPQSRVGYSGAPQTIEVMTKAALEDDKHFETRQLAEAICEGIDSKDYVSEYLALYNFLLQHTRYMRDPRRTELVRAPYIISKQMLAGHRPSLDCLPGDTLILKKGHQLCPLADIRPGDEIWGYDRWSTVQATAYKGELPVDAIMMNNGSTFFATPDHKVYIMTCSRHPAAWDGRGTLCKCETAPEIKRIPASDLMPNMVLLQPGRIPFGDEEMDPGRAYIEGLYQLQLQTRLLHRMFGTTCGETFISNHGGLGKNPIWRLFVRGRRDDRNDTKREKVLRVKSIERAVQVAQVYDLQTDDHYVYLPHADVTVSNCDDLSTWLAAAVLAVGGSAQFATVAFQKMMYEGQVQYSHVFTCAIEPRARTRIVLDPVAAEKTSQMLGRIQAAHIWPPLTS